MLPIHCNWQPTILNPILFHCNASNHLKINTNGPELSATSISRLKSQIHFPETSQNVSTFPKLLRILLESPVKVVNSSQIIQNRLETSPNASNRLSSPCIQPKSIRIAPKLLLLVPIIRISFKTSINCSQTSCLVTKSSQYASQVVTQTPQNVSSLHRLSRNQLQSSQNGLSSSKMSPLLSHQSSKFLATNFLRYHSISLLS